MWETLVIHHSKDHRVENRIDPYFQWKTCQRSLYIGDTRQLGIRESMPGYEIWQGFEAYTFLLEVVTGMRSALFAETEVLHQFKTHFANDNLPPAPFGDYLSKLRDNLIEDTKYIRRNYLMNLGDQSYGGLSHRILGDRKQVVLIGSGQLAEKVLPFLKKSGRTVLVAARNPIRREMLASKNNCKSVSFKDLQTISFENVVIAAPVPVSSILEQAQSGACIVDLRDNDLQDKIPDRLEYHSFAEILGTLDKTRDRHQLLRKQIKVVLNELTDKRKMARFELVHGWEDIPCTAVS